LVERVNTDTRALLAEIGARTDALQTTVGGRFERVLKHALARRCPLPSTRREETRKVRHPPSIQRSSRRASSRKSTTS
jgi:hypothetical protein